MNEKVLNTETQKFININLNEDPTKVALKGSSFFGITIQEIVEQIIAKKKCKIKLPTWFHTENIYYPNKLNIEQTSSEIMAKYKANLVSGNAIIDITGGFGVDCFAFAEKFKEVTHCEINTKLSAIVEHNFKELKVKNIKTIAKDGLVYLKNQQKSYDWIYADPSRRDDIKGRVFLLEDCLPNIPENLNFLFDFTDNILIKTSPVLDISSAIFELGFIKEVHIIAIKNEVKELLYLLEKNYIKRIDFKTINITKKQDQIFNFNLTDEEATYSLPLKYLYEPNAAILKSGGFQEVSVLLNIQKLHKHSHLYTANELIDFPGRRFKILHNINYDKRKLKKLITSKKANITTRNFPETVAQIRKKTGLKEGGNVYLFFTTDMEGNRIVLVCEKV